eukprot:GHVT01096978.1.p1 GENE.GHVT01096978.1~~GHVT01096978.1.p1  ORF type:complete len:414 (-),score=35.03 GHVT01096978.1:169-1410(-)
MWRFQSGRCTSGSLRGLLTVIGMLACQMLSHSPYSGSSRPGHAAAMRLSVGPATGGNPLLMKIEDANPGSFEDEPEDNSFTGDNEPVYPTTNAESEEAKVKDAIEDESTNVALELADPTGLEVSSWWNHVENYFFAPSLMLRDFDNKIAGKEPDSYVTEELTSTGTAVEMSVAARSEIVNVDLNGDWVKEVRPSLLSSCGVQETMDTSICFFGAPTMECCIATSAALSALTPDKPSASQDTWKRPVEGTESPAISNSNQDRTTAKTAWEKSIREAQNNDESIDGFGWCTSRGHHSGFASECRERFDATATFLTYWCPPNYDAIMIVDSQGSLLNAGTPKNVTMTVEDRIHTYIAMGPGNTLDKCVNSDWKGEAYKQAYAIRSQVAPTSSSHWIGIVILLCVLVIAFGVAALKK